MKKVLYFIAILILTGFLLACWYTSSNKNNETLNQDSSIIEEKEAKIKELKKQNDDLLRKVDSHQLDLKHAEEQIGYYQQFSQDALLYLSEKELLELAKMQWIYSLEVNDKIVPKNGKIEIEENTIHISLAQTQSAYNALPAEIDSQGAISGKYEEHIQDLKPNPTETNWTDGTVVTAIYFKYAEVSSGKTVSFSITEELKERLGLDTTLITIVKK